jgi:thioredoxin 1
MNLNKENFDQALADNEIILIDFWADWCGPCKKISPILDEISKENNLMLGKVDIDSNLELSEKYQIRSVPTMILFKNSVPVKTVIGARPKHVLLKDFEEWI